MAKKSNAKSRGAAENRVRKKRNLTFDEEVWRQFTDRCKSEGRPASRVLERLMEKYIDGDVKWETQS